MRKLSVILTILILTSMLVPAVVAQGPGPGVQANPTGEVSHPSVGTGGTGTLWENGEPDDVNGLASELNTIVSDARTADDFLLEDGCGMYNIERFRAFMAQNSNPLSAVIEIYADSGGVGPLDPPLYTFDSTDYAYYGQMWGWIDGYEVTFETPGLQLPPGHYWVSSIGLGDGTNADRAFFMTTGNGAVQLQEGYFKSNYFGYPNWVPASGLIGTSDYSFDIDGQCAEPQNPMYAKVKLVGKMQGGAYIVNAIARVIDAAGAPVEGAEVTMFLKKPNANTKTQVRLTNANGRVGFPMASPEGGYWLACIEDVQHPLFLWDDSGPKCDFLEFPAP
jgi:hypothetical protein